MEGEGEGGFHHGAALGLGRLAAMLARPLDLAVQAAMRIAILGAGPAGLYLGYLLKRRRADAEVAIVEQNPADATFGFGVVFSDRALEFLREGDAETFAAITPQMEAWDDMTLVHRNLSLIHISEPTRLL